MIVLQNVRLANGDRLESSSNFLQTDWKFLERYAAKLTFQAAISYHYFISLFHIAEAETASLANFSFLRWRNPESWGEDYGTGKKERNKSEKERKKDRQKERVDSYSSAMLSIVIPTLFNVGHSSIDFISAVNYRIHIITSVKCVPIVLGILISVVGAAISSKEYSNCRSRAMMFN